MKPIRLMLVDDHDVVRAGLRAFIESRSGFEVVAEAGNGLEAIEKAAQFRPELILLDITMPEMDGLEAASRLKEQDPSCLILALTVHEDKQYFMKMLAAGASGYLTKQAAGEELVAAMHAVAQGHVYLQPALARWLLEDYQRLVAGQQASQPAPEPEPAIPTPGLDALSKRERQVLEMVGQGLTNQEIGACLELSPKTVARHRERIMGKLNLHSRTELVKFAIRTGLIDLG